MTRGEVLARLKVSRAVFDGKLAAVRLESLDAVPPGATHSVKDIVAHVTAYDDLIVLRLISARHGSTTAFDRDRDGIVCGEGSGILLLESLESALGRGASVLAEITGFATNSDPASIANPNSASIADCMRLALADAELDASQVDYVNAHATATQQGDIAECGAIADVFGSRTPTSSLKGHLGHAMAASGSLELAACIEMIRRGVLIPTLNLDNIDPLCAGVAHQRGIGERPVNAVIKNNFALGGVNSSIILRRYQQ